jgi:hypothetical protein
VAEIGADHLLVATHNFGRAFSDLLAMVEYDDLVRIVSISDYESRHVSFQEMPPDAVGLTLHSTRLVCNSDA